MKKVADGPHGMVEELLLFDDRWSGRKVDDIGVYITASRSHEEHKSFRTSAH
jgi:hypothetical protein